MTVNHIIIIIVIIIIITTTMIVMLSSWPKSFWEFTQFIWWMQTERRVAANSQTKPVDLGCESAENWQLPSTIAIVIITQPVSWYSFYRPTVKPRSNILDRAITEGRRLSRPTHCSKGAQPVPKAVYRSSYRVEHNRWRRDSNLGPVILQSDVLITRPLQPCQL